MTLIAANLTWVKTDIVASYQTKNNTYFVKIKKSFKKDSKYIWTVISVTHYKMEAQGVAETLEEAKQVALEALDKIAGTKPKTTK
jgi:hypothetical protein